MFGPHRLSDPSETSCSASSTGAAGPAASVIIDGGQRTEGGARGLGAAFDAAVATRRVLSGCFGPGLERPGYRQCAATRRSENGEVGEVENS